MPKRVAVMDLGTNTFHLLIAEGTPSLYNELCHDHIATKLGEGGINKGIIQPAAFERGLQAMKIFRSHIDQFGVTEIKAIATSAIRSARNGKDFIAQVSAEANINIETIEGNREAGYIFKGVQACGILNDERSLILDIGGGSIEFIIADKNQIHWKESFEIGAARLMDKFHQTDPIPTRSVIELQVYLDEKLKEFFAAVQKFPVKNIIGSSGAFETFAEIEERNKGNDFDLKKIKTYEFDNISLLKLFKYFNNSSHQERLSNTYIIPVRVDMIVVASIVTRYLMQKLSVSNVAMSVYSLKEGVLAEMLA